MLFQLVKKQMLLIWRNPVQIFYLFGLPIILIIILSMALAGFMEGGSPQINLKVAWLAHGDEAEEVEQFIQEIEASGIPAEAVGNKEDLQLTKILREEILQGEELQEMIELEEISEAEKTTVLADDSYSSLIEIPENFTYDMLHNMIDSNRQKAELVLHVNQEDGIYSSVLSQILDQFNETLAVQTFLNQNDLALDWDAISEATNIGERVSLEQSNPISSGDYYTVGMTVFTALYIASTIGMFVTRERQDQIFDRIIISDMSRWQYFFSVLISGALLTFIQFIGVFTFSYFVLGVSFNNLGNFLLTTACYSIAVGGIAVLLTAISYRLKTEAIIGLFTGVITSVLAFLGGSFFPVGELSESIQQIGNMTPNGAALSAYIQLLRGSGIEAVSNYLIFMLSFGIVMIIIAAMSFPKRGAAR
ncbi:ABC transporter permease [Ornithinibacillus sp. 4-3]|uniref:ABC transporter permease n=1 Tax=Ornithinibacillus sp. 4-3 TaxID=3231488 RepID=A0AB39HM07_9BACI